MGGYVSDFVFFKSEVGRQSKMDSQDSGPIPCWLFLYFCVGFCEFWWFNDNWLYNIISLRLIGVVTF